MGCERLIIFARYPEAGKAKTRLIPAFGAEKAAGLQRQMTEHTLSRFTPQGSFCLELHYAGGSKRLWRQWLGEDIPFVPQSGGDLGARMQRAFEKAFAAGGERVVIIGTDCPGLGAETVQGAFAALQYSDLVLGPARDGGYYLIGLKRAIPPLWQKIPWGTERVLEKTRQAAAELGLQTFLLEPLADIDRPQDIPLWKEFAEKPATGGCKISPGISIIIPMLNEAANIGRTLACIPKTPALEVILVDGGSSDGAGELARSYGARVYSCLPAGRARQMNLGASQAAGAILLFLHADTRLPAGFEAQVRQTLAQPDVAAGAFHLQIEGSSPGLRLVERVANWRSRVLQLPYGDQAIFLAAKQFHKLGGFPDIPIMEDWELLRGLRRQGRIVTAPLFVLTSARRWKTLGLWQTTLINQAVIGAYYLGVDPLRIARWYRRRRNLNRNR